MKTFSGWINAPASGLQDATQSQAQIQLPGFTRSDTNHRELTFDFHLLPTNRILLQSGREAGLHLQPLISQKGSQRISDRLGSRQIRSDPGASSRFWLHDSMFVCACRQNPAPSLLFAMQTRKVQRRGSLVIHEGSQISHTDLLEQDRNSSWRRSWVTGKQMWFWLSAKVSSS